MHEGSRSLFRNAKEKVGKNMADLLPNSDANKEKSLSPKDQIKGHPRNKSPKLRKFDQYGEKTDLLTVTCSGMDKTAISSSLDRFIYSPIAESRRLEDYKVQSVSDYRKEACFLTRKVNVDLVLDILTFSNEKDEADHFVKLRIPACHFRVIQVTVSLSKSSS
ncbi:hypothetical protein NC652_015012 [Populus alba x Populus x berolinensis]|nr:hypothetical protein NC652_015012 [Populus alba x Populus x berolinensis]